MFREALQQVVDGTEGAIAAILMGYDGIPVEQYLAGDTSLNVESIGMEFSVVLSQIRKASEMLEAGAAREVTIHALEVLGFEPGERAALRLRVRASKGTYVRTLAEDIGAALGCGAHVSQLRRVASGQFVEADAVSLERLQQLRDTGDFEALDALMLPAVRAVQHLPAVVVAEAGLFYLGQGQAVMVASVPPERGMVRVMDADGEFRGVGEITDDRRVAPRRMMAAQTAR